MERTITEHQHDDLNKNLDITSGVPGPFGAPDYYCVSWTEADESGCEVEVLFQSGALKDKGTNGVSCEALIVVMLDRLRAFQAGPLKCSENDFVIRHLEQALFYCVARSERRKAAGVKGTAQPAPEGVLSEVMPPIERDTEFLEQFFAFAHLPMGLQAISRPFGELAERVITTLPRNPERTTALRKLLEAKDCAVRANVAKG